MNKASTLFYWLFNATFYIFILVAIIITGIEVNRWIRNDYRASYSIGSFKAHEIVTDVKPEIALKSSGNELLQPTLTPTGWKVSFDAADGSIKALMAAFVIVQVLYLLLILVLVRRFVSSLKNNETFTMANIKRLQWLGILLLLIEPLHGIGRHFFRSWLTDHLDIPLKTFSTSYQIGYSLGAQEFVWNWIFAGLLVLTIAEVFKQGLKLKEESDLTV